MCTASQSSNDEKPYLSDVYVSVDDVKIRLFTKAYKHAITQRISTIINLKLHRYSGVNNWFSAQSHYQIPAQRKNMGEKRNGIETSFP